MLNNQKEIIIINSVYPIIHLIHNNKDYLNDMYEPKNWRSKNLIWKKKKKQVNKHMRIIIKFKNHVTPFSALKVVAVVFFFKGNFLKTLLFDWKIGAKWGGVLHFFSSCLL